MVAVVAVVPMLFISTAESHTLCLVLLLLLLLLTKEVSADSTGDKTGDRTKRTPTELIPNETTGNRTE